MKGRKKTPTHLRVVGGNAGHRPLNDAEPTATDALPIAPAWLNKRARDVFGMVAKRLDEMGYASASHTEALALLAMRLEEVEACSETIEKLGGTYEGTNTNGDAVIKTRPEVHIRAEASRHAQSLLAEFGLTPASATKIVVPKNQKKNAFAQHGL